jgi:transcription antitermination factor NusG
VTEPIASHWYCAIVSPAREFSAERALRQHGYETLLPTELTWRRYSRHAKRCVEKRYKLWRPILPRMVFVGTEYETGLSGIMDIYCVRGILSVGGVPRKLKDDEMEMIRDLGRRAGSLSKFHRAFPEFKKGEYVRIVSGPLQSFGSVVEAQDKKSGLVTAEIEILGRKTKTVFDPGQLEKVRAA